LIQQTSREAQSATLLPELSAGGRKAFYQHGTEIKEFTVPPSARNHTVHSLVDLILYARRPDNQAPVVWHDNTGVVLLVDDADRRERVTFPLTWSERLVTLQNLAAKKPCFDQAAFVRLLRIELGLDNVAVVAQFRKLEWSAGNEGSGDVQHGMNRLAKSVVAKVQGIGDLPDELNVPVPVYQQMGEQKEYLVKCAVEIDTCNQRLQLLPLPDTLERVVDLAQASIHERLVAALGEIENKPAIPVYYGRP
jgi:hypothetical protein